MRNQLMLVIMIASLTGASARADTEAASMAKTAQPEIRFKHTLAQGKLKIDYVIENRGAEPIYVLDRMWDRAKERVDQNWAWVEVDGKTAAIKRAFEPMPANVTAENPRVPYAREIAAGGRATGTIVLSLPLKQEGQYDAYSRRDAARKTAALEAVKLRIGWCSSSTVKMELSDDAKLQTGGETLWDINYSLAAKCQTIAESPAATAAIRVRVYK